MSSKHRTKNQEKRYKEKVARRKAMKERYAAYAASGNNSKRKLLREKRGVRLVRNRRHANGTCGNHGCVKCNPTGARNP